MYCTGRGKEMPEGAAAYPFCWSDAARAAGGTPPPQPPPGAAPAPQPPLPGAAPAPPQPVPAAISAPPASPAAPAQGRGGKRLPPAFVAVAVMPAVAAGTAIPLLPAKNGKEAQQHGTKVTLKALGDPSLEDLQKAAHIVRLRLEAMGIDGAEITIEGNGSVAARFPGATYTDRLLGVIGSAAQLQFREVLEVMTPQDEGYGATELTVADPENLGAYRALRDREIVLEKEMEARGRHGSCAWGPPASPATSSSQPRRQSTRRAAASRSSSNSAKRPPATSPTSPPSSRGRTWR